MNATFTYHAIDRIHNRLAGLVRPEEVAQAISSFSLKEGDNYIDVKFFPKRLYLGDPRRPETPKGDKITAKVIVENGAAKVITVMLRKSTSRSPRYLN